MQNRRWIGDDLHNLLYLPPADLRIIYPNNWESLRAKRKLYRRKVKKGEIMAPRRSEEYPGPHIEKGRAADRRRKLAPKTGETALQSLLSLEDRKRLHDQLDELLDSYNLDADTVDKLGIKKISHWEMGYKDGDGEAQSHPLYGITLEADPRKFEPQWPVVNRVESVRLLKKEKLSQPEFKTCMIFPDVQIPFHDEDAIDVALGVMRDIKPDKVVFLGDLLDLSAWGRFIQQKEFAFATQEAVNTAHKLLATIRKMVPTAEIQVMAGNHEERLPNQLLQNAKEAYGLKRADDPEGWPVLSVPYLCAFDTLDIDYIPGYPANRLWLNKNLQIRHGSRTQKKGVGVRRTSAAEKVSTIQGHDHRLSSFITTINTFEGGQQIHTYGSGCLCRLDGHVPSAWSGRDLEGVPVTQYEDWSQAFVIASYDDDNFHVEQVPINTFNGYQTLFRGKIYRPRPKSDEVSMA